MTKYNVHLVVIDYAHQGIMDVEEVINDMFEANGDLELVDISMETDKD